MAMTLNSPVFRQNGHIPSKYTCEGEDVSPPLAWEGVPDGAKNLVLIIDDPDAPDPKAPKIVVCRQKFRRVYRLRRSAGVMHRRLAARRSAWIRLCANGAVSGV